MKQSKYYPVIVVGGGHAGAAGWSGICDEVELESVLLATLSAELLE